jgi:upstream activation factor subunit UAF30
MAFNPKQYEHQIRAILQAPDVDLQTISAKRVRKQLLEDNPELSEELIKEHKDEIDVFIGKVYEEISAALGINDEAEEPDKRKREDDESQLPPSQKKLKQDSGLSDADLARKLSQELNGLDRGTRASSSAKPKAKRGRKSAKSAATVDSDGEGGSVGDASEKPKRKGGFTKEYTLRYTCHFMLFPLRSNISC